MLVHQWKTLPNLHLLAFYTTGSLIEEMSSTMRVAVAGKAVNTTSFVYATTLLLIAHRHLRSGTFDSSGAPQLY